MTVENTTGREVAHVTEDMSGLGLEDASISDIVIPRLRILHKKGMIADNLSSTEYPRLRVILLGLVKQRIMWHEDVEDEDRPQCKSPNFEQGFPNVDEDTLKKKRFPWDVSNFSADDFPASSGVNGLVTLPCAQCKFKEWGQDKKPPLCSEQHTYPLLYDTAQEGEEESWVPALFTVQKTGIKPSRNYLSAFVQSKKPMFTAVTELTFSQHSRGSVEYSVPIFKRIGNTEPELWEEYANTFRTIRDFAKQAPRSKDSDDYYGEAENNANTAPAATTTVVQEPVQQAAPTQAPVQQAPAPAQEAAPPAAAPPAASTPADDDGDLPF